MLAFHREQQMPEGICIVGSAEIQKNITNLEFYILPSYTSRIKVKKKSKIKENMRQQASADLFYEKC